MKILFHYASLKKLVILQIIQCTVLEETVHLLGDLQRHHTHRMVRSFLALLRSFFNLFFTAQ